MNILFLDQSGKPGGAELCLLDTALPHRENCLVGLFADGDFRQLLEQAGIPVQVLMSEAIAVRKESGLRQGLGSLGKLLPLIQRVAQLSRSYDLIYANTQKALVVGALASWLGQRPLVYHLHDILSADHFSTINRRLAITLANRFASLVIANSEATRSAFLAAGGRSRVEVVYNGFQPTDYQQVEPTSTQMRQQLGLAGRFIVGHFSRLSPWKGQHVLIEALAHCPDDVIALFVGDALFGEQAYVEQIHQQVQQLGLNDRVKFLGFRSDVIPLMKTCDLVAHTSIAPEPFGRVIVEAMLCGRPVVAAQAGGAIELVIDQQTGWLIPPGEPSKLAAVINHCRNHTDQAEIVAQQAQTIASQRFHIDTMNQQITQLLQQVCPVKTELHSELAR
jgi:glycosyltransferase involved in cell wall biosynthesis